MKILLAVDDSEYSDAAVEEVASRPWPPGTIVLVLSAVQIVATPGTGLWFDMGSNLQQALTEATKNAEELTARVGERLRATGLTVETAVREGDPRSVIVDEAKDWSADLIVVASHGRSGIARLLLGSVAHSVVSHAPCSVEVVRKKVEEA